jgi:hypothetical protein
MEFSYVTHSTCNQVQLGENNAYIATRYFWMKDRVDRGEAMIVHKGTASEVALPARAWVSDRVGPAERNGVHRGDTRDSTESKFSDQLSCNLIECCIVTADLHLKGVFDLVCSRGCARLCAVRTCSGMDGRVFMCEPHIYSKFSCDAV